MNQQNRSVVGEVRKEREAATQPISRSLFISPRRSESGGKMSCKPVLPHHHLYLLSSLSSRALRIGKGGFPTLYGDIPQKKVRRSGNFLLGHLRKNKQPLL